MAEHFILNDDHTVSEVEMMDWAEWLQKNPAKKIVKQDDIDGRFVSTVFLGLNHQYGDGPPLIFETMVFESRDNMSKIFIDRYSTYDEALTGHDKTVEWVRDGCKEEAAR